ncbi:MAG: cytochrome c [Pseudomonadota bacterium]
MTRAFLIGLCGLTGVAACAINEMPTRRDGERIFANNCAACHDVDATGGALIGGQDAPDLTLLAARNGGTFPRAQTLSTIDGFGIGHAGRVMPEFGALLDNVELVPIEVDDVLTPTPQPFAAILFYLESIQEP